MRQQTRTILDGEKLINAAAGYLQTATASAGADPTLHVPTTPGAIESSLEEGEELKKNWDFQDFAKFAAFGGLAWLFWKDR